jgi:hypothetical protein
MYHLPRVLQHISPSKLRHLQALPVLEELTLGCHHRLIASTVTDSCLVELVALTNLKHLNLSQCVHVRDAGAASAGQVGNTLALSLAQSFCRSDANPTWRASDLSFVSSLHYLFKSALLSIIPPVDQSVHSVAVDDITVPPTCLVA